MFEQYYLKNKTKVILNSEQDAKSVTILIMFPVGSRYEPEKLSGMSHYIEHMMFKGTKKRPTSLILTREIDRLGAEYNAFTSKEYTGYYIKVDVEYTAKALDILSDMLLNSKFDAKEMEKEKHVVVEEIRMYDDNPIMSLDSLLERLLYAGCPLGRDIAGTAKHVLSYPREEVLKYRDNHYTAENTHVVLTGNILPEAKDLIEKYFGQITNKKPKKEYLSYTFGSTKKIDRLVVKEKETDQSQMAVAFPGYNYESSLNSVIDVMNTILGSSMSSRLFMKIREKHGLAYMVRSGHDNFRDTGHFFVRLGLDAKNINKALKLIVEELERMKHKLVTPRELNDAKTHLRGKLMLSMEDTSTQASWYASEAIFKKSIKTPEEYLQEIDVVTAENIKNLANKIFRLNEMRVAIIGNISVEEIKF